MKKCKKIIAAALSAAMVSQFSAAFAVPANSSAYAAENIEAEINNDTTAVISIDSVTKLDGLRSTLLAQTDKITDIVIEIAGGTYNMDKGIVIDKAALKGRNLTIKAKDGETPVFKGTKPIDVSKFHAVTDKSVLEVLTPSAASYIGVVDLKEQGFTRDDVDFTSVYEPGGSLFPTGVYFNDSKEKLARYPNSSYLRFENVIKSGGRRRWAEGKGDGGVFEVSQSNVRRWGKAKDAYLEGAFGAEYFFEWAKIGSVDTTAQTVTMADWTQYGMKNMCKWSITNLVEELDIPGEWYIDFDKMLMYYYPRYPIDVTNDTLEIAVLKDTMLTVDSIGDEGSVTIDGLTFCNSANNGIDIFSSPNVTVKNCKIYNMSKKGIYLKNAAKDQITCCDVYETGAQGIHLETGGDRNNLISNEVVIDNNHIYRTGMDSGDNWCGGIAIGANTEGTSIKNNIIHGIKNYSYTFGGNENDFAYNEVYNGNRETADSTPIYCGRKLNQFGNTIRYNYVHDCVNAGHSDYTNWGITTGDDWQAGTYITNNIINMGNPKKGMGCGTHSRDNIIQYNIIMCSKTGLECNDRYRYIPNVLESTNGTTQGLIATLTGGDGLKNGFSTTKPWLEKYPEVSKIYSDIVAHDGRFMVSGNMITDNISVEAKNNIEDIYYEVSTVERNLEFGDDYSIFVDPENHDYRLKMSAVEENNLSDKIINEENFSMDEIGIQTSKRSVEKADDEFRKIFPQNGAKNLQREGLEIAWERAVFADQYNYIVATDPELNNVIAEGTTFDTSIVLEGLENDTTYYWNVTAENISKQLGNEWKSVGEAYCFRTSQFDKLDKTLLYQEIERGEALYETIEEGTEIGDYQKGTKDALRNELNKANAAAAITLGKSEDISNARTNLLLFINRIDGYKIKGYITPDTSDASKWQPQKTDGVSITAVEDGISVSGTARTIGYKEMIPANMLTKFKIKAQFETGWVGLAARQKDVALDSYSTSGKSYLIVIKPDIFEFQKYNTNTGASGIIKTVPNNGIFKSDTWHDVVFGAVNVYGGVEAKLIIDGQEIFDYYDSDGENYEPGHLVISQAGSQPFTIKAADDTSGIYEPDDSLFNQETVVKSTYFTTKESYTETGVFEDSAEKGYEDGVVRVAAGGEAKWDTNITQARYKFYYWHTPLADGDKHAKVIYNTTSGIGLTETFEKEVDFSCGEAGWREIGTFMPISAGGGVAPFSVTIQGSGQGKIAASAIRLDNATDDDLEFSKFFHSVNKDLVLMKIGVNKFFNNIEEQALDVAPQIQNDRTLVPVRAIAESFGFDVTYNTEDMSIGLKNSEYDINMKIGDTSFTVNGETKTTDVAPFVEDDRTLLPLRAMAEAIGKQIYWDAEYQLVLIGTKVEVTEATRGSYKSLLGKINDRFSK